MSRWITWDYQCQACGWKDTLLQERDNVPDEEPCPECEGTAVRIRGGGVVLKASYPDGHVPASRKSVTRELAASARAESHAFSKPVGSTERKEALHEAKERKRSK